MFCPVCGKENGSVNFCDNCHTNLAVIERFLAREDSDALWEKHQADELRQYHTGLKERITVSKPFRLKKPETPA